MSQLEVDKIIPQSGTTLTIGDSGDTVNFADGTNLSIDTNTLYIDSTNNRVGIANASPSVALDVTGAAKVSGDLTVDNTTGAELILSRNDTSIAVDDLIGGIQFKANDASSSPDPQICGIKAISTGATNTNPKLSFFAGESNYNANTPNMSIDSGGNITMSSDLTVDTNTLFVDSSENTVVIGGTDATSWNANADELVVAGASAGGMTFYNPTQTNIFFADGTTGDDVSRGRIQYVHSGNSLIFGTDATERARIDGSGDLLIGKTSISTNAVGVALLGTGLGAFTRASSMPIIGNRTTDDGDIIQLRKDNSTVGQISVSSSRMNIGTGNTALRFDSNSRIILPWNVTSNSGTGVDNAIDLGADSGYRFKDLYLGNSIDLNKTTNQAQVNIRSSVTPNGSKIGGQLNLSLGSGSNSGSGNTSTQVGDTLGQILFNGQGTDYSFQGGSIEVQQSTPNGQTNRNDAGCDMIFGVIPAGNTGYQEKLRIKSTGGITFNGDTSVNNALDDYEEGTWTMALSDGTNSAGSATGYYTKIGNMVFVRGAIGNVNTGSLTGSNDLIITGLPFATSSSKNGNQRTSGTVSTDQVSFSGYLTCETGYASNTELRLVENANGAGGDRVLVSQYNSGSADLWVEVSYPTEA